MGESYTIGELTKIGRKELKLSKEWYCFTSVEGEKYIHYGLSRKGVNGDWDYDEVVYGNITIGRGGGLMKRKVAKRRLQRKCIYCNCGFVKGEIYYVRRTVTNWGGEIHASEYIKCSKCKYINENRETRYEKFRERCVHPERFVEMEYSMMYGESIMEPSHEECRLCRKIV